MHSTSPPGLHTSSKDGQARSSRHSTPAIHGTWPDGRGGRPILDTESAAVLPSDSGHGHRYFDPSPSPGVCRGYLRPPGGRTPSLRRRGTDRGLSGGGRTGTQVEHPYVVRWRSLRTMRDLELQCALGSCATTEGRSIAG